MHNALSGHCYWGNFLRQLWHSERQVSVLSTALHLQQSVRLCAADILHSRVFAGVCFSACTAPGGVVVSDIFAVRVSTVFYESDVSWSPLARLLATTG